MNDDTIADLKQFIATTVRQEMSGLATKDELAGLEDRLNAKVDGLSAKIDDLQASVAAALDATNDEVDKQLQDHEARITRLEHKAA